MRIHTAIVVLMLVIGSLFFPDAASAQHRNPDGSCSITVTGINGEPSHEQAAPEEECAAWEKFEAQKRREAALRIMLLIGSVVLAAAVCAAWVWQRRRRKATAAAPGTPGSESKATPSAPAGRTASSEESAFGHGGAEAMPSSSGKDSHTTESPRGAQGVRPAVLADAIAHYNARRYSEAQTALAAAHAAGADPEQCFYYSALAHLSTGNLTAAKQQLEKTVSLAPRNPDAHFYLGELLMKEGAVDAALNHFRSVASLRPDHARARQRLSQLQPSEAAKSGGGGHGAAPAGVAHREGASTVRYGPWHAERQQEHVHEQDQVHVDAEPRRGDPYDLLRGAKDDVSQAAVSLIRETRVEPRKPIMRAYLGTRLMLLAAVAALFLLGIVGVNVGNSYHQSAMDTYYRLKGNGQDIPFATADVVQQLDIRFAAEARIASLIEMSGGVLLWAAIVSLLAVLYYMHRMGQTIMSIDRGVITIEKGILSRTKTIHEIYRVTSFEAEQDFFNRMTGDASLVLDEGRKKHVYLKGLATYDDTQKLAQKLRDLHLLLRTTNIGKGIMQ